MNRNQGLIRVIPDFPKKGILFQDISTLIADAWGLKCVIDYFATFYKDQKIDQIVGLESRGFLVGTPLAIQLNCGFTMVRKKGKLPSKTISFTYKKEYGDDTVEINADAFKEGANILIIDDLIATGGTIIAAIELVRQLKGNVIGACAVVDLFDLGGSKLIEKHQCPVYSILKVAGE